MVAKLIRLRPLREAGLNLAKIHMVAKRNVASQSVANSLNLAKIHMVAKQVTVLYFLLMCLNLAKIHMVAKLYLI